MKCLIIAAGKGSRMTRKNVPKPLVHLLGLSLIERVILTVKEIDINDFYVVTGYNGEEVRQYLDRFNKNRNINITHIINEEWEKGNGISVLKAKKIINENFILLMSDHIFNGAIVAELKNERIANDEVILTVDYNITDNKLIDIDDVTKVFVKDNMILDIGKKIDEYNAFDTGIFLCTTAIFDAIEESLDNGDSSLSGGIRVMAGRVKAKTFDIKDKYWIDVDDRKTLKKAEKRLLITMGKTTDGPVSRRLNRPISTWITRYLVKTNITPNTISFFSFTLAIAGASLFFLGGYINLLIGAIMAQASSIVDGCDGEIARLKFRASEFGGWFDAVLDRYSDAFLIFGLTCYVYFENSNIFVIFIGFLAIIGSFMNSYTADKYDGLMREKLAPGKYYFRLGRDVRIFIIFIGAIINQPFLVISLIALLMNTENVRRIVLLYRTYKMDHVKKKIEEIISKSSVPEDLNHSKNTLEWLLKFKPDADEALKIAALGHDIERAIDERKVKRVDYKNYDEFKDAHALNSAVIMAEILRESNIRKKLIDDIFYLVRNHETGGTQRVNILKNADSISFFNVNLKHYFSRNRTEETKERIMWGLRKLPNNLKKTVSMFDYDNIKLYSLVRSCIDEYGF